MVRQRKMARRYVDRAKRFADVPKGCVAEIACWIVLLHATLSVGIASSRLFKRRVVRIQLVSSIIQRCFVGLVIWILRIGPLVIPVCASSHRLASKVLS